MVSRTTTGRLVVITEPESAAPFRFTAATVIPVDSAAAAQEALVQLLRAEERGVIAIHEPFFDALDAVLRTRCEAMVAPVVLPLPTGSAEAAHDRRARLTRMLQRAIGYQMTFEELGS